MNRVGILLENIRMLLRTLYLEAAMFDKLSPGMLLSKMFSIVQHYELNGVVECHKITFVTLTFVTLMVKVLGIEMIDVDSKVVWVLQTFHCSSSGRPIVLL